MPQPNEKEFEAKRAASEAEVNAHLHATSIIFLIAAV